MKQDRKPQIGPGSAIYVPRSEAAAAMSMGAVLHEGDSRLHIPSILPSGVRVEAFSRWSTAESKISWIAEFLESIVGAPVDLTNVAGLVESAAIGDVSDEGFNDVVPLYVPSFDLDLVRAMRGVSWDRRRRVYVADRTARLEDIFPYLTPSMRAVWIADKNLDLAMTSLVRSQAMKAALSGKA